MAKKSYNNIDGLFADLEKDVEKIVNNTIKNKVIEMAQNSVQENVLDVYEPQYYKRRSGHNLGGLKDTWESEVVKKNNFINLKIINNAKSKNKGFDNLAENIEEGYGKQDKEWNRPRPFIDKVQEKIDNGNEIENILEKELKNKGW